MNVVLLRYLKQRRLQTTANDRWLNSESRSKIPPRFKKETLIQIHHFTKL